MGQARDHLTKGVLFHMQNARKDTVYRLDKRHGYRGFEKLLKTETLPEAILAVTFPVALGVTDAIQQIDPSLQEKILIYSFEQHGLERFFAHPHIFNISASTRTGHRLQETIPKPS